jgi:glycosyltransferase involved in cell wall biosynthesis
VRIAIVDLKWSYGIESLSVAIRNELLRFSEVEIISATESQLPYSFRLARSRTPRDMVLAFLNPLVQLKLVRRIRQIDPDVVYINSPHLLNTFVAAYCRLFTKICVVSLIHDPDYLGSPLAAFAANSVAHFLSKMSHRVYCMGRGIRDMICERFRVDPSRVTVFRHGPNQRTFYDSHELYEPDAKPIYFSFIGTVHPRKGIQFFLKAAKRFNELHGSDKVKFLVAGAGDGYTYQSLMEELPNLVFINRFMENEEVNGLLRQSYALILPYVGGMLQSSFPAIAYGNGCPVIVSRIGSLYEEVEEGKTGYVVEKENSDQIFEAMCKVFEGNSYRELSTNAMHAYIEKFRWDKIGEEMYRDVEREAASVRGRARRPRRNLQEGEEPRGSSAEAREGFPL